MRGILNLLRWVYWRYVRSFVIMVFRPSTNRMITHAIAVPSFFIAAGTRNGLREGLSRLIQDNKPVTSGLVYGAYANHVGFLIKLLYLSVINNKNVDHLMPVEGISNLDRALENGKGAIILNPHFGPYLLLMPALGHRGYKVNQVAVQGEPKGRERRGLDKKVYELKYSAIEGNMPANFINPAENRMAARDILRSLERNEIIFITPTGRRGKSWHQADFLNGKASFVVEPYKLAMKTGAPILPAFIMDSGPLASVVIEKPLEITAEDTAESLLEKYINVLSSYAKKHPDHFAFFLYEMKLFSGWDEHPFFVGENTEGCLAESRLKVDREA